MTEPLSASSGRVQAALEALGLEARVVELAASTRTAREAAAALGCEVAQIAKSIVFRGSQSDRALLVIASGVHRVDEADLAAWAGEPVARASPEFVRRHTGFAIGGVPPLGHPQTLPTWVDAALLTYDVVWAAAGTPRSVFALPGEAFRRLPGARVVALA